VIGWLARVGGVALDARFATRSPLPAELARAASWIAGNLLAARGVRVQLEGVPPDAPAVIGVRAGELAGLLAALAKVPALVDARTIPLRWRALLRGLGMPVLDGVVHDALLGGASVVVVVPVRRQRRSAAATTVQVLGDDTGYRVRVSSPRAPQLAMA